MKKTLMIVTMVCFLTVSAGTVLANTNSVDLKSDSLQYLSITDANQTGLGQTGDFLLEALVKFKSKPGVGGQIDIISKWTGTTDTSNYDFRYRNNGGTDEFRLLLNDNYGLTVLNKSYTAGFSIGTWYRISVALNESVGQAEFFIDGYSIGTTSKGSAITLIDGGGDFRIGAGNATPTRFLDGLVDDVRVWDDIGTSTEISDNAQQELTGSEANLRGYWQLNNDLLDKTSNNNDLTNNNGAVFSTDVSFSSSPLPPPPASTCSIVAGSVEDIKSIPDLNSDGQSETVLLGVDSYGVPTVCITKIDGTFIREGQFLDSTWTIKDVYITDDLSITADGIPDISVMAVRAGEGIIQIRDTADWSLIQEMVLP